MNETKTTQLQDELQHFSGSEEHFAQPLLNHFIYSEGAKYFFEHAGDNGAYWMATDLATEFYQNLDDDFYVIKLQVNEDQTAILTANTGVDESTSYQKKYNYTDIEPSETPYKFYADVQKLEDTMRFYLPSEY